MHDLQMRQVMTSARAVRGARRLALSVAQPAPSRYGDKSAAVWFSATPSSIIFAVRARALLNRSPSTAARPCVDRPQ